MAGSHRQRDTRRSSDGLFPVAWPVFVGVWILFPVGFVVQKLASGMSVLQTVAFLISIALFIAIFLALMLRYPFPEPDLPSRELRATLILLAALAVMAVLVEVFYSSGTPYRFMYVIVASGVVLPTRKALWAVALVTVFVGAFTAVRYGWTDTVAGWAALVPFPLIGLGMIAVGRLVVTVRELRKAREEIARLAVSEERLRFARDLHDLLGHSLSLITLKSELAGRLIHDAPERATSEIHDIEDVARGALKEVREAVAGYRRPTLAEELTGAKEMLEAAGIAFHPNVTSDDLPPATAAVLAWTVREGVTNVIRHSRADRCDVTISATEDEYFALVTDDGAGPRNEGLGGSGLAGLSERARSLGGSFEAGQMEEGGFSLRVGVPITSSQRETDYERTESGQ